MGRPRSSPAPDAASARRSHPNAGPARARTALRRDAARGARGAGRAHRQGAGRGGPGGQQRGRRALEAVPADQRAHVRGGLPLQRHLGLLALALRGAEAARARRRSDPERVLGDGARHRPRLQRLRRGQGRALAPDPPARGRARSARARERARRRCGRDLGARSVPASGGHAREDGGADAAAPDRQARGHRGRRRLARLGRRQLGHRQSRRSGRRSGDHQLRCKRSAQRGEAERRRRHAAARAPISASRIARTTAGTRRSDRRRRTAWAARGRSCSPRSECPRSSASRCRG